MSTSSRRLRTISWVAMLALLVSALAPAASRAFAAWSGTSSPWNEICTAFGIKQASPRAVDTGPTIPAESGDARVQSDCPFCLPSGTPAALPSRPAGVPAAVERENARYLFFFISAPYLRLIPESARPRAPPQSA